MLSEFLLYLVEIVAVVGGILLLERIVAGPHSTAGTGYARVDSAFDFDRLRREQYGAGVLRVLRHGRRSTLPLLQDVAREPWQLREAGEQLIPLASIVGQVDGASQLFDQNFRPVSDRARARLGSVLVAMRQGEPFPPIEVWAWRGEYYVLDGHHRVAAARALGSDYISAHVTEVVELSHYDAKMVGFDGKSAAPVRAHVVSLPTASSRSSRLGRGYSARHIRFRYGVLSGRLCGRARGRRDPGEAPARFPPGTNRSIQIPTTYSSA